mgnify:CR=1 FL=1
MRESPNHEIISSNREFGQQQSRGTDFESNIAVDRPKGKVMPDISQVFADRIHAIFEQWKANVRNSRRIDSSEGLSETALENSVFPVLEAMTNVLSKVEDNEIDKIVHASFEHGSVRANQGYDAGEISREYSILRQTIFSILEPELRNYSPKEIYRAFRAIDATIDEASSQCFQQFVRERTQTLEHLHDQLEKTNQELARLLQLNQDSFSHLVHELKTPLNSIMGYSQLLLRHEKSDASDTPKSIEHIGRVLRSSKQLLQLVNDSLEVSRAERGKIKLKLTEIKPSSIIRAGIETLEPLARDRGLQLDIDCDRAPERIVTDTSRLNQIIINLLSNAVRYTEEGWIRVSCWSPSDDCWSLAVQDTGIGIPEAQQATIFQPFVRVAEDRKRSQDESTGLGLTVVFQLVKILQGTIDLDSQEEVGTTFTVTFPRVIQVD